jgi:hypothetical protein
MMDSSLISSIGCTISSPTLWTFRDSPSREIMVHLHQIGSKNVILRGVYLQVNAIKVNSCYAEGSAEQDREKLR